MVFANSIRSGNILLEQPNYVQGIFVLLGALRIVSFVKVAVVEKKTVSQYNTSGVLKLFYTIYHF